MWQMRPKEQVISSSARDLEHAGVPVDRDRASIGAIRHLLYTLDRSSREVPEHRGPIERGPEGQPKHQSAVSDQSVALASAGPKLPRGGMEHITARPIHLPDAAEAGCERDVRDREVRVIEQPAGEMGSARSRQLIGGDAEMLEEQSAEVASGDEQPGTEVVLRSAVEGAVEDELNGPADELGTDPGERRIRAIGPTP
jgi:hypothetical protein